MNTIYIFCNKLFHHFVVTMLRETVGFTRLRAVTDRVTYAEMFSNRSHIVVTKSTVNSRLF